MKRFFSSLLALLLLVCLTVPAAAADGKVTYSGNSGEFIFAPGSEESPTDLFPNFKDVMPGDTLDQWIVIKNKADREVKIKIYLRALGAHEDSEEFLSQLGLRVEQIGSYDLFDAAADETAQLTDWVCLGTLYSGGEIELNVVLEVPVTLDNNFKNQVGYLDWEFMIEEFPVEEDDPKPPAQTGDESDLFGYIAAMAGSGVILFVLILLGHKKKKQEEENPQ